MATASKFSSALQLTDLDDFIKPSQECIKPAKVEKSWKASETSAKVKIGVDEEIIQKEKIKNLPKANITLQDCLACSGCITSAETVLIEQQNHKEFLKIANQVKSNVKEKQYDQLVVSVSLQPILSFAIKYDVSPVVARGKLVALFRKLGAAMVYDIEFATGLSLLESGREFVQKFMEKGERKTTMPLLASSCPGWICYAEKTHGEWILPYVSQVKSPQQIAGSIIKDILPLKVHIHPSRIAHITVMPCFDKKLEARRSDFFQDEINSRDVDMVITPVEIEKIMEDLGIDFLELEEGLVDVLMQEQNTSDVVAERGSGSGGYAENILRYSAKKLFDIDLDDIVFRSLRNPDMREATVEHQGRVVLRVAVANGFRNIQNLVQKMKHNKCSFDYVEVMACPSGCLNGGAQFRPDSKSEAKIYLSRIESLHSSLPKVETDRSFLKILYHEWLRGYTDETKESKLRTSFHAVSKSTNVLSVKW